MGAKKLDKTAIAKHALCERLRAISTSALQAVDCVESDDDEWAEDCAEHLEQIDRDMETAYGKLDKFLEDEPSGQGGEETGDD